MVGAMKRFGMGLFTKETGRRGKTMTMVEDISQPKTWIDEMVEREALPPELREGTVDVFCAKWKVPRSTYYYQASKKENQDKIVELAIRYAKKYTSEVLDKLGQRALEDNKATELFMKFVLALAEKTDLTTKGEKIELSGDVLELVKAFEEKLKPKVMQ